VQPLGAIMPIAERQSELIAHELAGSYVRPALAKVQKDIDKKREAMRKRYVASKRHTIQVDYDDYMKELRHEMDAGSERSAAAGGRPGAQAHTAGRAAA
jgi:hypothetical protein